VIVAAYQACQTVERAVQSALSQPQVSEVVVVDDASDDDTSGRAAEAAGGDRRFRLLRLKANSGPARARNAALALSKAPLVCVLDADDWLQPGRFTRLFDAPEDWDLLADDLFVADEARPQTPTGLVLDLQADRIVGGADFVRSNISRPDRPRQELGFLKPVMRRSFLDAHGLRYDESLRLGEDYVLYAQALMAGARLRVRPACGYVAVRRSASLSHRHGAAELDALSKADSRLIRAAKVSAPAMTAPLLAHRRRLSAERDFRRMLNAKAEARWFAAVAHALRGPGTTVHIARELWRAKRGSRATSQALQTSSDGHVEVARAERASGDSSNGDAEATTLEVLQRGQER
jgi:succinoglycan biosynthesis protein ExoU